MALAANNRVSNGLLRGATLATVTLSSPPPAPVSPPTKLALATPPHLSATLTTSNFRYDVNLSSSINAQDVSAVKARAGRALP